MPLAEDLAHNPCQDQLLGKAEAPGHSPGSGYSILSPTPLILPGHTGRERSRREVPPSCRRGADKLPQAF